MKLWHELDDKKQKTAVELAYHDLVANVCEGLIEFPKGSPEALSISKALASGNKDDIYSSYFLVSRECRPVLMPIAEHAAITAEYSDEGEQLYNLIGDSA